jgi:hypothetical protein
MHPLGPDETDLFGGWSIADGRAISDDVERRIAWLIAPVLEKSKRRPMDGRCCIATAATGAIGNSPIRTAKCMVVVRDGSLVLAPQRPKKNTVSRIKHRHCERSEAIQSLNHTGLRRAALAGNDA